MYILIYLDTIDSTDVDSIYSGDVCVRGELCDGVSPAHLMPVHLTQQQQP